MEFLVLDKWWGLREILVLGPPGPAAPYKLVPSALEGRRGGSKAFSKTFQNSSKLLMPGRPELMESVSRCCDICSKVGFL